MKLVELLAKEMNKWPEDCTCGYCVQACESSDCGGYLKIGISGKPKKRFLKLSRATPFGFDVIRIIRCSGNKAISIESRIHSTFESAGFKGWDGATEWLKYDQSIIDALNTH